MVDTSYSSSYFRKWLLKFGSSKMGEELKVSRFFESDYVFSPVKLSPGDTHYNFFFLCK